MEQLPAVSVEVRTSSTSRHRVAAESLRERINPKGLAAFQRVIVTWPAYGYLDFALWRPREGTILTIVLHDPAPLRRQFGLGHLSSATVRRIPRATQTLVHSQLALEELKSRAWPVSALLPHPMLPPAARWLRGENVLVLGQGKKARDLQVLRDLGGKLKALGYRPVIVGRDWPALPGWTVRSGFVPEDEFDELIRSAACLLLPYRRVFQSGVAVRAAENAVPVVGPRESNLPELFGADWPGLIDSNAGADDWCTAVTAVLAGDFPGTVIERTSESYQGSLRIWSEWLSPKQEWA